MSNRRSFLQNLFHFSLLFSATGTSLLTMACSNSNNKDSNNIFDTDGKCVDNGTTIEIENKHTPNHSLVVSREDVNAGGLRNYTLENNGSGHTHTLTITDDEFTLLRNNIGFRKVSTSDSGHTHLVTISCA